MEPKLGYMVKPCLKIHIVYIYVKYVRMMKTGMDIAFVAACQSIERKANA